MQSELQIAHKYYSEQDNLDVYYSYPFIKAPHAYNIFIKLEENLSFFTEDETKVKIMNKWINIPRKQTAYGDKGVKFSFSGKTTYAKLWNNNDLVGNILLDIKHNVELFTGEKFNFCLVNRYNDGNDYIGPHKDDEKDFVPGSGIVCVSLGDTRDLEISSIGSCIDIKGNIKLSLDHGSILFMKNPTNKFWKHSILKTKVSKLPRISLTFRHLVVEK